MKMKPRTSKRKTRKSSKNSWPLHLIVLESHGRKIQLVHKVSVCRLNRNHSTLNWKSNTKNMKRLADVNSWNTNMSLSVLKPY